MKKNFREETKTLWTAREIYYRVRRKRRIALNEQDYLRARRCSEVLEFRAAKYMEFYEELLLG